MAKIKGAMLAAVLLACLLAACSREPPNLTINSPTSTPSDGSKVPDPFAVASAACKEEGRVKGIRSVAAIFSRLVPGKADRDYIACMRNRGFEVPGAPKPPAE